MSVLASKGQLRASFLRWALLTVPAVLLLGFLSGEMAGSTAENPWFAALNKPAIYPPPATFGIVWSILYVMQGLALAMVCAAWGARGRGLAISLFILQFLVSLAWTPVFFAMRDMDTALIVIVVLDILAIATLFAFWRVRRKAGWLLVPYIAWIMFATVLNYQFIAANPGASSAPVGEAAQRVTL